MLARPVVDRHLGDPVAAMVGEHGDEPVQLAVEPQAAHDLGAVRLQAAVHVVEVDAGDPAGDRVEELRRDPAAQRVASLRLPAGDQVEALVELGEQLRDLGGVVLEVAVDRDDHLALRLGEACGERRRLAEVPAQADDDDVAGSGVQPGQRRVRPVRGAVVDEHGLPGLAERLERRVELVVQQRDAPLLVVDGNDDRDHGREPTRAGLRTSSPPWSLAVVTVVVAGSVVAVVTEVAGSVVVVVVVVVGALVTGAVVAGRRGRGGRRGRAFGGGGRRPGRARRGGGRFGGRCGLLLRRLGAGCLWRGRLAGREGVGRLCRRWMGGGGGRRSCAVADRERDRQSHPGCGDRGDRQHDQQASAASLRRGCDHDGGGSRVARRDRHVAELGDQGCAVPRPVGRALGEGSCGDALELRRARRAGAPTRTAPAGRGAWRRGRARPATRTGAAR